MQIGGLHHSPITDTSNFNFRSFHAEELASTPSRPQLLPYEPPHVLAGKARAKPKPEPRPLDELLVTNFASGSSSGAKVFWMFMAVFLMGGWF